MKADFSVANLSNLIQRFCVTKDIKEAISMLINEICDLFKFDRSCIFLKHSNSLEFFKTFELIANEKSEDFSSKLNLDFKNDTQTNAVNEYEQELVAFFNDARYVNCENAEKTDKVLAILKNLNYEIVKTPAGLYVFYIKESNFTGYLTFEKNVSSEVSEHNLDVLSTLCELIHTRLENYKLYDKIIYGNENSEFYKNFITYDTLTNAISFKYFSAQFKEVVNNDSNYALCTLDVDKFMYLNNIFGYEVGNKILIMISDVISNFISTDEIYARINDDKFVILLKYDTFEMLEERMSKLKVKFDVMKKTNFKSKSIAISGGVTLVDKSKDMAILIDETNVARRSIKGSLLNKFKFFDNKLQDALEQEKFVEGNMILAITKDEYVPYIQAKFDIATKKLSGAEMLVRWKKDGDLIFPKDFIPIFEKNGFVATLDFVVYEKTFQFMRKYLDKGIKLCEISINVSRIHINTGDFVEKFIALVKKYEIPIELLELEVTESVFIGDKNSFKDFIDDLKSHNFKVSIDDFGTAYSSLNVLKDIDIDVLKIDKDFLHGINFDEITHHSEKDKIIIQHIVLMAKKLNFKVICEGVETEQQLNFLNEIGCEFGQGFLFAKPIPVEDFMERFYDCK